MVPAVVLVKMTGLKAAHIDYTSWRLSRFAIVLLFLLLRAAAGRAETNQFLERIPEGYSPAKLR